MTTDRGAISRRTLLIGGVGVIAAGVASVAAIETGLLPGRSTLHAALGLNGAAGVVPDVEPGPLVSGKFVSTARLGVECGWTVAYPPGSTPDAALPVLVVLHGYGGGHKTPFRQLGFDRFLAATVAAGTAPFAIAAVSGGKSYWHPRASGEDAGAMVSDEFLPLLTERGLVTDRIALLGWSMGGYGALLLASRLGAERVAAVVAESPALWSDAAHAAEGAFDDAEDYAEHELQGHHDLLAGIPMRIDCGTGDGFFPAARDYVAGFTEPPAGAFEPGGHDADYWRRMAPAQLEFVGRELARRLRP